MHSFSEYETVILALGSMCFGIIALIKGGNWAIDSAVFTARRFGISPLVVGFTIIAFGTSLPELIVSVLANLQGSPGIALGNVLGSNIANILMVLGCAAAYATLTVQASFSLKRDLVFMMLSTAALIALLYFDLMTRMTGALMITTLWIYVFYQYKTTKPEEFDKDEIDSISFSSERVAFFTILLGLSAIAIGAEFLVKGAIVTASIIGVPDAVIGLSIIALGTSLPELSTSIVAARKGQSDIVVGNIVGSNVFNILMIIGAAIITKPIYFGSYAPQVLDFDVWVTFGVSLLLSVILFFSGKITRPIGILFFIAYIGYNILIFVMNTGL
ncbi:MAG: calcium/sodium antiporter [Alphaproteobacteria bacterium]|nr:calcium/sodium antiporter [Alphaproteobacteria bacterium]